MTTPVYDDGIVTLYHGDAAEILADLEADPARSVVITDPPWANAPATMLDEWGIGDPAAELERVARHWPRLARRAVVHLGGTTDPRMLAGVPMPFVRTCALRYVVPARRGPILDGHDIAYVFGDRRPPARPHRVLPGDCIATSVAPRLDHPCPRHPDHVAWLVGWYSLEGETVIDPFVGSGTTLAKAKAAGRRAIGVERVARYIPGIIDRLRQDVLDLGAKGAA